MIGETNKNSIVDILDGFDKSNKKKIKELLEDAINSKLQKKDIRMMSNLFVMKKKE
tara:strand:- start:899 stop:1066 length:168 start_codon:yes stop_codon:yes gene_type:complete